jgi:hypothetical protein
LAFSAIPATHFRIRIAALAPFPFDLPRRIIAEGHEANRTMVIL